MSLHLGVIVLSIAPLLSFADSWQEIHRETRVFEVVKDLELSPSAQERLRGKVYVRSVEEFAIHTVSHIQRVQILGRTARREISLFKELPLPLVEDYLRLHDRAKINFSDQFLKLHSLGLYNHPLFLLAEQYGVARSESDELTHAIETVNELDRHVSKQFLMARGLMNGAGELTSKGKLLVDLERLVDVVDTAMSRVRAEELGRQTTSASLWFKNQGDHELSQAATILEARYHAVVAPADYTRVRAEVMSQLSFESLSCSDLLRQGWWTPKPSRSQ